MKLSARALLAIAVAGALALTGCSAEGSASAGDSSTYRIGLINPTTGASSWAGTPIDKGARTAIDEANESGYLGDVTLELTSSDSEGDPAKAVSQYRGFASDGYLGVICCTISTEAGSFAQLAAASKMPTVANGATLAGLAAPPYLYRTVLLPAAEGGMYTQMIQAIVQEKDVKTAAIVQTADNEGNVADAEAVAAALEDEGVQILEVVDVFQADTDFTVPITKIDSLEPDLVVFSTQGPKSATMIKTLRDLGWDGVPASSYGVAVPSVWDVGGAALDGTVFPLPFSPLADNARTKDFVARYTEEWGETPDLYSAQGYNAARLLIEGIKKIQDDGGAIDRETLAQALTDMDSLEFVSGNTVTIADGQVELADDALIAQWNADGTQSLWQ